MRYAPSPLSLQPPRVETRPRAYNLKTSSCEDYLGRVIGLGPKEIYERSYFADQNKVGTAVSGEPHEFSAWQEYHYVCYIWFPLPGAPGPADEFRAQVASTEAAQTGQTTPRG